MKRHQTVLVGLLALQLLVILLVKAPWSGASTDGTARVLLPDLATLEPSRIEFEGAEGESLTLEKREGSWVVDDVDGYPADDAKISDLIDKLAELEVRRPVVKGTRYHKAFEVADDENLGRVRVYGESAERPAVDLILGNSPNYRVQHIRLAGENDVFEARGLAAYDVSAEPGFWAEKQLVEVAEDELVGIRLENAAGVIELARDDGGWRATAPPSLVDAILDESAVETLLNTARSLRIDTPVGQVDEVAQGLADAPATVTLSWRSRPAADTEEQPGGSAGVAGPLETLTYRVGSKVPEKESQRFVSRNDFGFTGTVWESSIGKLIEESPDDLVAQEPEGS